MKTIMVQWKSYKCKARQMTDELARSNLKTDDIKDRSSIELFSKYAPQPSTFETHTASTKSSAFKNMDFKNHHRLVESKVQQQVIEPKSTISLLTAAQAQPNAMSRIGSTRAASTHVDEFKGVNSVGQDKSGLSMPIPVSNYESATPRPSYTSSFAGQYQTPMPVYI